MFTPSSDHFRHHARFYASAAAGLSVWSLGWRLGPAARIALAGDCFFLLYLALVAWFMRRLGPDELRALAKVEDEGIGLIVLVTLAAIALALGSFALLLNESSTSAATLIVALATVPLGWLALHTVMAFHYAHLFYAEPDEEPEQEVGGLTFPGEGDPAAIDFLYHAFTIGMTAQVSDVQATNRPMRGVILAHATTSFFFNTVILALAVNVAITVK